MLSASPPQSIGYPKNQGNSKKVREMLEILGMDISDFDKCKACRNSKDRSKIATIFV